MSITFTHYFCSKYPPKAFFKVYFSKFSLGRSPKPPPPLQWEGVTPSHNLPFLSASRLKVPLQATSTLPFSNSSWSTAQVDVDGTQLDVESNFCYLGDMLCAGGGCKLAIVTRCSTAWGKFKRLLPILTSKHVSLRTRGKVFNACVRSALLHGSETWAPTAPDLQRLRWKDRSMVRWICRVRDDDKVSADTLCAMLGVQEVTAALRTRRLRWYGHVARSSSCINSITSMTIPSARRRGRP